MKKVSSLITRVTIFSFFLLAAVPTALPILATEAAAQSNVATDAQLNTNVLVDVLCNVIKIVTGNAGKAFAAFAIISVGVGFFTGKVSWGLMIGVTAGIAAMFGAPTIVAAVSGTSTFSCG